MKKRLLLILMLCVAATAYAVVEGTNVSPTRPKPIEFPTVSTDEIRIVLDMLDSAKIEAIMNLSCSSPSTIHVVTSQKLEEALPDDDGSSYTFTQIDGKWTLTERAGARFH